MGAAANSVVACLLPTLPVLLLPTLPVLPTPCRENWQCREKENWISYRADLPDSSPSPQKLLDMRFASPRVLRRMATTSWKLFPPGPPTNGNDEFPPGPTTMFSQWVEWQRIPLSHLVPCQSSQKLLRYATGDRQSSQRLLLATLRQSSQKVLPKTTTKPYIYNTMYGRGSATWRGPGPPRFQSFRKHLRIHVICFPRVLPRPMARPLSSRQRQELS